MLKGVVGIVVLVKWILGIIAVISLIFTIRPLYTLIVSKESFGLKVKSLLLAPLKFIYTFFVYACILFLPLYIVSAVLLTTVESIGEDDEETAEEIADSDMPEICKEDPNDFSDEAIEELPRPNLEYLAEGSTDYDRYRAEEEEYIDKIKEMYSKQREYDIYCDNHPRNEYPDGYDPGPDYNEDSGTNDPYIYWVDEYYRKDGTQVDGHYKTSQDGDTSNNLSGQ